MLGPHHTFRQREGVELVVNRHQQVLSPIEFVSHGTVLSVIADPQVPQSLPRGRIEGQNIAINIGGKQQMPRRGQDARPADALTDLVIPLNLAGTIIDGTIVELANKPASRPAQPSGLPVAVR